MNSASKIPLNRRLLGASCTVVTSALALAASAVAQTTSTWTGAVSDAFTDAENWDAGVPTTGVDAIINNGLSATISASDTVDFNALTLNATSLDVNGGSASLTGVVNVVGNGILSVNAGTFSTAATGDAAMYVGTTDGAGMLNVSGNSESDFGEVDVAGSLSLSRGNGSGSGQIYLSGYGKLVVGESLDVGRDGNSAGLIDMRGNSDLTVNTLWVARNSTAQNRVDMYESATIHSTHIAVGEYASYTNGTLTMSDSSKIVNSGGEIYIGDGGNQAGAGSGATGTLEMSGNSSITMEGDTQKFVLGRYGGVGTVNVYDNASIMIQGDLVVGENVYVSDTTAYTATLTVDGEGALVQTGLGRSLYIGSGQFSTAALGNGAGSVILNNGTIDTNGGLVIMGLQSYGAGSLTLNGGTLKTAGFQKGTGTAAVNFDGGTVQAAAGGEFFSGFADTDLTVGSGGLKFDTNGSDVSITVAMSGDGGLTKQGAGNLTLGGANTFTGASAVSAGTLQISGSLAAIRLDVAGGATLEIDTNISLDDEIVLSLATGSELALNFDGTETIGALWLNGTALTPGEYSLDELNALASGVIFSGMEDASLLVTSTVPEPATAALLLLGGAAALLTLRRKRA